MQPQSSSKGPSCPILGSPKVSQHSRWCHLPWLKALLGDRSISTKIKRGYTLVLSISVLGTVTGLTIGNIHQHRANQQMEQAHHDYDLLSNLQTSILEVRSQQLELFPLLKQADQLKAEQAQLIDQINQVRSLFAQLQTHTQDGHDSSAEALHRLTQTYEGTVESYAQQLNHLLHQVEVLSAKNQQEDAPARQLLFSFINSPISIRLRVLSQKIAPFIDAAEQQEETARDNLARAEDLRNGMILGSVMLSILIAAVLVMYTSRAIAHPIEAVTKVAQRAAQNSDFDLEAPVLSRDEIGVLAISFNHLIHKITEYTQALELSHQTLEERVATRTQELRQTLQSLQLTQSQLLQSEKMSSLGHLVAGVAHEINNPVNFIHGNLAHANQYVTDLLDLLQLYDDAAIHSNPAVIAKIHEIDLEFLQEDLPKLLSSMQLGTDRIREIVRSLRNFSRLDEADVKAVNLHEGLNSTLLILQHRLKAKPERPAIQIVQNYGNLPLVECYAGPLNQVFMNILSNAIEALEEQFTQRPNDPTREPNQKNSPRIEIRTTRLNPDRVAIFIADNGPGMPDAVRERLFDPFFTTKPVGKGTGMGMSISYQIVVEKHHGSLSCHSVCGEGTEFRIELPIQPPAAVIRPPNPPESPVQHQMQTLS